MLKKRDLQEVSTLFELASHPEVFPYIRDKAYSVDEFYFMTHKILEAEANGELISRTILDECEQPIGTINLYDLKQNCGFLATWIGKPYFGQGYNQLAKQAFLEELFFRLAIETVFIKIRKVNIRSLRAMYKLPYVQNANQLYEDVYRTINQVDEVYDLFVITKEHYSSYTQFTLAAQIESEEDVS